MITAPPAPLATDDSALRRDAARRGLVLLSTVGAGALWYADLAPAALALLGVVAALGSPALTLVLMVIAFQLQGWALPGVRIQGMAFLPTDALTVALAGQVALGLAFGAPRRLSLIVPVCAFFAALALSMVVSTGVVRGADLESSTPFLRFFLTNLAAYLAFLLIDEREAARPLACGVVTHAAQVAAAAAAILVMAAARVDLSAPLNQGVADNASSRLVFTATQVAYRAMGTYGDPNVLSETLLLLLTAGLIVGTLAGRRLVGPRVAGLFIAGVMLAQARTGLLGLFVVLGIWFTLTSRRRYRLGVAAAFVLGGLATAALFSLVEQRLADPLGLLLRQQSWQIAFQRYADGGPAVWLLGIGFGRYNWLTVETFGAVSFVEQSILNTYLMLLVEAGALGVLLFAVLLLAPLLLARRARRAAGREVQVLVLCFVAGFAAVSLFDATLFAASPVSTLFFIGLGAIDRTLTAAIRARPPAPDGAPPPQPAPGRPAAREGSRP